MLPKIKLRSGLQIEDPLRLALDFIEQDGSYRTYDLASVAQDNLLTESDIRVANAMIARMSPRVMSGIFARAPVINAALARVPPAATLAGPEGSIPWRALELLMQAVDGIPEVRLARQTKVLHKKRPALIPVLDSVVEAYLRRVDSVRRTGDAARDAVALFRSYKRELDSNLTAIRELQAELLERGIQLTECRLLDLFLWAYSGTYTPMFLRGAEDRAVPQSLRLPRATNVSTAGSAPTREIEVEIYRDDDEGYLAWLSAHRSGFVLNVARRPRPTYAILHRATCRTINGTPPRGGPWTGPYIKICSDDDLQIAAWTGRVLGTAPKRCGVCH